MCLWYNIFQHMVWFCIFNFKLLLPYLCSSTIELPYNWTTDVSVLIMEYFWSQIRDDSIRGWLATFLSNVGLRSLYTLISEGMADLEYLQVNCFYCLHESLTSAVYSTLILCKTVMMYQFSWVLSCVCFSSFPSFYSFCGLFHARTINRQSRLPH